MSNLQDILELGKKRIPSQGSFEDDFPFPVWWDMLVSWKVSLLNFFSHLDWVVVSNIFYFHPYLGK